MNWYKGHLWPYSPAILQVKVFYSSSIVLENRIACERCQKYFKVKLNDLPTVYDHWLKVTGLLIKIPDPLYWWRSFTGGWYIFYQDRILYFTIVHFEFGSFSSTSKDIFDIHMVILIWFPKYNWLDHTDPRPSHGRPVHGRFHRSIHVRPTLSSVHLVTFHFREINLITISSLQRMKNKHLKNHNFCHFN